MPPGKGLIHSPFNCSAFDAASFLVRLRLDQFGPVASADKPEHLSKGWEQGQKEAERGSNIYIHKYPHYTYDIKIVYMNIMVKSDLCGNSI